MPERPIIFSGPMVRAILEGRKSQTRRLATSPLATAKHGDRLWVRETWTTHSTYGATPIAEIPRDAKIFYPADASYWPSGAPLRPSIHMPRWASRITLRVTQVRRQRLQDLSYDDARTEGLSWVAPSYGILGVAASWHGDPREAFAHLWNTLHSKPGTTWDDNPEVVALTFRRIDHHA